jgi:hypothetical protein
MSETGETEPTPTEEQATPHVVSQRESFDEAVRRMHEGGLPDGVIANHLKVNPNFVKSIRKRLGLASMTATQAREVRKKYMHGNQPSRYEIVPPPIEGLDEK